MYYESKRTDLTSCLTTPLAWDTIQEARRRADAENGKCLIWVAVLAGFGITVLLYIGLPHDIPQHWPLWLVGCGG
jgi:hypothetical protein